MAKKSDGSSHSKGMFNAEGYRLMDKTVYTEIDNKAKNLRGRWLALSRKHNIPKEQIPTIKEIGDFLWASLQFHDGNAITIQDYYGGKIRDLSTIELDHKQPLSKGGSFGLENIAITCRYFNQLKGNLSEADFKRLLEVLSVMDDPKSLTNRILASGRIYTRKKGFSK